MACTNNTICAVCVGTTRGHTTAGATGGGTAAGTDSAEAGATTGGRSDGGASNPVSRSIIVLDGYHKQIVSS